MQTDGPGFLACSLLITVLCISPQRKASQPHGLCDYWCYRFFSEPCLDPFYLEPWAQVVLGEHSKVPSQRHCIENLRPTAVGGTILDKEFIRIICGELQSFYYGWGGIWGCVIWFNLLWHYQDVTPLCLVVRGYNHNTDNKLEAPDWLRYSPPPYWTHRAREPSRVE